MANPLFGTTATQVAAWWVNWGPERTQKFLEALKMNEVVITSGNAEARNLVASGQLPLCLTDTDDAIGAILQGHPVRMVCPDQGENGEGTLLIPNTVALIKNAPHSEHAKRLIDFLLSPAVEKILAQSDAEQIPLRAEIPASETIRAMGKIHFTDLDFAKAAKIIHQSSEMIRENLID